MDEKIDIIKSSKINFRTKITQRINKLEKLVYISISLTFIVIIFLIINMIFKNKSNPKKKSIESSPKINDTTILKEEKVDINGQIFFEEDLKMQKNFCENETLFYDENFEKKIKLVDASFQSKK